jgi:hypothetical protein
MGRNPGAAVGAVKIKSADKWFSLCIRERANWTCERCGAKCPDDKRMGLHCSHYHGRGKWATRFDPDNCRALCYGCHSYVGGNPDIHRSDMIARLGPGLYEIVLEKSNDSRLGRMAKRSEKEIAAHYRAEYRRMVADTPVGGAEIARWC